MIFGRGTGPYKTISSSFPNLVRLALKHQRVLYAGEGTNIWAHVHIQDVSDMILLQCLKLGNAAWPPAGFERFYLYVFVTTRFATGLGESLSDLISLSAENGEHQKFKVCTQMASILHAKGAIPEPTPLSVQVDSPNAPSWTNRTTARCSANRAKKELDWRPKTLLEDVFEAEILDILSAVQPA